MKKILFLITFNFLLGVKLNNIPISLYQPDGTMFECLVSGDEFYNYLHDINNFTIIQNEHDGFYYYAKKNSGDVIPSQFLVNSVNPSIEGLQPNVFIAKDIYYSRRNSRLGSFEMRDAPSIGTINNINVFIRFSDDNEFQNSRSYYNEPFNNSEGPSLYHYFKEVSYDLLTVNTIHYPSCDMSEQSISYVDEYPRNYYHPYNQISNPIGYQSDNEAGEREQILLKNAIEYIQGEVPDTLNVDSNNDGYVDNVTFLVKGSPGAWADLLWPHRWALYLEEAYINGARVWDYNLNLEQGGYFTVGTLCHEFFHSLGAPDLYHYWDTSAPIAVGGWDVMDASSEIPQSMSAYMKYKYTDWITELPILEYSGNYHLLPLSMPDDNILRINSPSSINEYFVVEYRVQEGIYEINTPGDNDGLLIYRVNDNYNGNANGPPDELYLYRTGGTLTNNGIFSGAVFNADIGQNKFNDNTDPNCFLTDGSLGGINLSNISSPGETISFDLVNLVLLPNITGLSFDSDSSGVINPGEDIILDISLSNLSYLDATNIEIYFSTITEGIEILNSPIFFDVIANGQSIEGFLNMHIGDYVMGDIFLDVEIFSIYNENNLSISYNDEFQISYNVSLNQSGFPINTLNEIRSSPIIIDLDLNGTKEIIFGDHFGIINAYNYLGENVLNDIFPFETAGQIWGDPVAVDLDLDGFKEVIFVSNSGYVFVFDYTGLKWSLDLDTQLIGTPSAGNINDDEFSEIFLSGYSNRESNYFVLSHAGENLNQITISDKSRTGFAVGDFNDNQYDDVVFGTDENNLYLLYDNYQIADGFPFQANDKFQHSPIMVNLPHKNIIVTPCKDKKLYAIKDNGEIDFAIQFNEYISTSPSILNNNGEFLIFIGLNNGQIYAIDLNGNIIYEYDIFSKVVDSISFSDLNGDFEPEIIAVNNMGDLFAINLNGDYYDNFPLNYNFPYSSGCLIDDIDYDYDLEIFCGTTNSLFGIDIKESIEEVGFSNDFWSMPGYNQHRNNYYKIEYNCSYGDLDFNGYLNIFDIILLIECIIEGDCSICADSNIDGYIDVIDIVTMVSHILSDE